MVNFTLFDPSLAAKRARQEKALVTNEGKRQRLYEENVEGESSSDTFEAEQTNLESFSEFREFANSLEKNALSFLERIQKLRERMSLKAKECDLYIDYEERDVHLKLTLQERPFKSSIFKEENLRESIFPQKNQTYFVTRLFEYIEDEKHPENNGDLRLLKFYASPLGTNGEIAWVQRGHKISGNDLATLYSLLIEKILPVKSVFLYDDAKHGNSSIRMRKLKILTAELDTGRSWYEEKWGFQPAALNNFVAAQATFNQDPEAYREAITALRDTPLTLIKKLHRNLMSALEDDYIGKRCKPTLHLLVKKIAEKANAGDIKAEEDLNNLFTRIIDNVRISKTQDENYQAFLKSVRIIEETRVFIKINPLHIAASNPQ
ncbi:Uncharacterized protein PHSC3_000397 [Chlamydiales bacterium STE3]|nr:Uncharacterized protein PHSC3_000397 [Chlamydiales bacterium STE3]